MSEARKALGARGEDAAVAHLRGRGYVIVARNFRTRHGELDIIARDGGTLVFVEVRTRTRPDHGDPLETVSRGKQARVIRMARWYLATQGVGDSTPCRFDVVGIVWGTGKAPEVTQIENAFWAA